ncbi:MAG TPA: FIST N-terminal domain-containing protein [Acidobacteriaceae bacterium]|nr:FIST N-terminal domain-containing protein [Acidobacteriaceae bacterium]
MTATASAYSKHLDSRSAADDLAGQVLKSLGAPNVLIVFASSQYDYTSVLETLRARFPEALLVGCSSAGEFSTNCIGEGNISVFGIRSDDMLFSSSIAEEISSQPEAAAKTLLAGFRGFSEGTYRHRTALILNDALAGSADELVHALNRQTGGKYKFFGGGAGDDAAFTRTHVFHGTRSASNAVVALEILSTKPIGIGVRHGWKPASDPMRVTSASGSVVDSLDAVAASEVFERHAQESGQSLDVKAPLPFFLHNIVGIKQEDGFKLRVPLGIEPEGAVSFAAEIPLGSAVSIMCATSQSSAIAAREATEDALRQLDGNRAAGALMFDCVATRLRLGKEFGKEVEAVRQAVGDVALAGCNTYGQVASAEGQFTGFHNCTAVVCVFPE